ncbi:MAG: FlgB family protein [Paracoccus sp. (in: a-proteobacteria)]|nr:FlgB family protein [Paracoccus sp. (in: a-proteobacteria)]
MFDNIDTIRMARALTAHASTRARLTAVNVANSDTPGFKPRDLRPFQDSYRNTGAAPMRATQGGHFTDSKWGANAARINVEQGGAAPNGNAVSLEDEMFRIADLRRQHELSLTVYQSSLGLMRSAIGRG